MLPALPMLIRVPTLDCCAFGPKLLPCLLGTALPGSLPELCSNHARLQFPDQRYACLFQIFMLGTSADC